MGTERFCALPCDDQGRCAEGFRCVNQTWTCEPVHGSCRRPVCLQTPDGGRCLVPASDFGELCAAAQDCVGGACGDASRFQGLALCTRTCTGSEACCDSGDLVCMGGSCGLAPGIGSETEPNNLPALAQPLPAGGTTLLASLAPVGGARDRDVFKLSMHAGDSMGVEMRPVCGTAAPGLALLVTLQKDGRVVARADAADRFGRFMYGVPADGDYYLFVEDRPYGNPRKGAYVLAASW